MSAATAHRLLELANRHDLMVVEDDIFADLLPQPLGTLASLDELNRVVYLSSFSKTISPTLRAGYLVATPKLAQRFARAKATISLGSSELLEHLLLRVLTHGHYRRHLKALRARLAAAHLKIARELQARGVELAFRPQSGLFLWAKLPSTESVSKLWQMALNQDVLLAPGEMFRPDGPRHTPLAVQRRALRCASALSVSGLPGAFVTTSENRARRMAATGGLTRSKLYCLERASKTA